MIMKDLSNTQKCHVPTLGSSRSPEPVGFMSLNYQDANDDVIGTESTRIPLWEKPPWNPEAEDAVGGRERE